MRESRRKLAVATGASTGIGLELARECAKNEFDLLIAANKSELENAADEFRREGGTVDMVQADRSHDPRASQRRARSRLWPPRERRKNIIARPRGPNPVPA